MKYTIFQIINLFIVLILLGVPVVVTILILRYFKDKKEVIESGDSVEFLVKKINELEERVKELEEKLDVFNID